MYKGFCTYLSPRTSARNTIILLPLLPLLRVSTVVHRLRHLLVRADRTPSSSSGATLLSGHLVFASHIPSLFATS